MILAKTRKLLAGVAAATVAFGFAYAQQGPRGKSSYMPVEITEPFSAIFARLSAQKPEVTREHMALLNERYDLSNRPAAGVTMDRTKPVQEGVRVKLPEGKTWEALANMSPEQTREQNLFPKGFYPLPHPKHSEGGFVFPHFLIDEIKRQEGGRDLTRFDVEYAGIPAGDLPQSAHRPWRRLARQARHHRELLRTVQRHSPSQADRRFAPSGDAVPATAVQ